LIAGTSIAGPLTLVFLGVALLTTALAVEILRRLELVERLVRVDMPKARLAALTRGFETERLDVRLPRRVPPALDRMLDEEFMHQNGWSPAQRRQLMELLRRPRWVLVEHGYLVAYERTTGEPVGLVTFSQFDRRASRCELGFMVGPAHRGRGF